MLELVMIFLLKRLQHLIKIECQEMAMTGFSSLHWSDAQQLLTQTHERRRKRKDPLIWDTKLHPTDLGSLSMNQSHASKLEVINLLSGWIKAGHHVSILCYDTTTYRQIQTLLVPLEYFLHTHNGSDSSKNLQDLLGPKEITSNPPSLQLSSSC